MWLLDYLNLFSVFFEVVANSDEIYRYKKKELDVKNSEFCLNKDRHTDVYLLKTVNRFLIWLKKQTNKRSNLEPSVVKPKDAVSLKTLQKVQNNNSLLWCLISVSLTNFHKHVEKKRGENCQMNTLFNMLYIIKSMHMPKKQSTERHSGKTTARLKLSIIFWSTWRREKFARDLM